MDSDCSVEERSEILKKTEYNMFSFPSPMITVDYLSDSGSSSMTDVQWCALMRGDEAYGRTTATTACWMLPVISSSAATSREDWSTRC